MLEIARSSDLPRNFISQQPSKFVQKSCLTMSMSFVGKKICFQKSRAPQFLLEILICEGVNVALLTAQGAKLSEGPCVLD